MDDNAICGTCIHWNTTAAMAVYGVSPASGLGICENNAVQANAGVGAVVLLGAGSHCQCYDAAWEPNDEYRAGTEADACAATMGV